MRNIFIVLLIGSFANNSFAYYQAKQGRWLSRDPINEKGFIAATKNKEPPLKRQQLEVQSSWGSDSVIDAKEETVFNQASKSCPNRKRLMNRIFLLPV